ncbi:hypothetical protein ACIBCM_34990 [Streptomyces sp. NPDC051018]|uniref:hypothetical protein n=1 Tax=Streptomyces sp. NPDC051018 TaxID=3365639 RepID=UPI003797AD75
MTTLLIHDTTSPWTSTDPALDVSVGGGNLFGRQITVNRLRYEGGPPAAAEFVPEDPLDLTGWDELGLWVRSDTAADGTRTRPFYLTLSYADADDAPGEEHRWFIPVNAADAWEQCPIGIGTDRRARIVRFRLETVGGVPFAVELYRLRAVREEMLKDVEQALADALSGMSPPGLTGVPLSTGAAPGDSAVQTAYTPGFAPGNRILLRGSPSGDEEHDVDRVEQDPGADRTRLSLAVSSTVRGTFPAGDSSVSVVVPVGLEDGAALPDTATPRVEVSSTDVREDPERTGYVTQRDSFRPRGPLTLCTVRPPARAYTADYRITAVGQGPGQRTWVHNEVLTRLNTDRPLWINDAPAPVWMPPEPCREDREEQEPVPVRVHLRVGSHMQTGPREALPWVRRTEVRAGRPDTAGDDEGMAPRP